MNGYTNPNAANMGNFGANKNYMMHGNNSHVNLNELLPEDPYKQQQKSKWVKESEENHRRKQQHISAQQQQFVPDSFKNSSSNMFVDVNIQTTNPNKTMLPKQAQQRHQHNPQQQQ